MAPQTSLYAYADNDPVSFTDPTGRLKGPLPRVGVPGLGLGAAALITFDIWIIQHDIDLLRQLCEAYGYCTPTPQKCEKRPPTLSRCLDACEGGLPLREAFCRSIPDPALAARCWSHRYDSDTSCRNWCYGELGK